MNYKLSNVVVSTVFSIGMITSMLIPHTVLADVGNGGNLSIGNLVWEDADQSLNFETYEKGLADVVVTLYDESGTIIDSVTTGADGVYEFNNLLPGTYKVVFDAPDIYQSSTGSKENVITKTIELIDSNNENIDIGYINVAETYYGSGVIYNTCVNSEGKIYLGFRETTENEDNSVKKSYKFEGIDDDGIIYADFYFNNDYRGKVIYDFRNRTYSMNDDGTEFTYGDLFNNPSLAPKCEVPTTEEPTTEAPVTEAPATEAPATEAPTTEAPTTEAPVTEAPTTEAPTTEAPTTEAPTTEVMTTEAPKTEAPTTEGPTTEAPKTEAPTTEAPTTEAPITEVTTTEVTTTEAPTTEVTTTEAPKTEAPKTEAPATEAPATEAPTTEAPTTEAPTTEVTTTEAPTTEAPTTEASATEGPTTEAPTTEALAREVTTTEAPVTEAPKTEIPVNIKNRHNFNKDNHELPLTGERKSLLISISSIFLLLIGLVLINFRFKEQ